jgi:hypothetical protein
VIAPLAGPAFSTRFHASRASPSSGDIRASRDAIATSLGAAGGFDHLEPSVGQRPRRFMAKRWPRSAARCPAIARE